MLGSFARFLALKGINTLKYDFWADVAGDIEDVNGVLKITQIRVDYHLKIPMEMESSAREAFTVYLSGCPAAQSVIGCIRIIDDLHCEAV